MADLVRPFDNFKSGITEPRYFFGRGELLSAIARSPFQVRILLGGRRLGKTSALNAVKAHLLGADDRASYRAFPVLLNLQQEQPESLDNFRYVLIARLREAIERQNQKPRTGFRNRYRRFLRQFSGGEVGLFGITLNVTNPDSDRRLIHEDFRQDLLKLLQQLQKRDFEGVCFLLDGAEFIVRQDWANDAWSYLRGLKDNDDALKPFLGLLLSGYRDLKDYQQRVGSPLLNIAEVAWLGALAESETRALIAYRSEDERIPLASEDIDRIVRWAGCHPYLTQQMLNLIFDDRRKEKTRSPENLMLHAIRQHDRDFSPWWDKEERSYGFSELEQAIYLALVDRRKERQKPCRTGKLEFRQSGGRPGGAGWDGRRSAARRSAICDRSRFV